MNTNTKAYISINNNLNEVRDIILGPDKRVVLLQRGMQILYSKMPSFSIVSTGEGVTGLVSKNVQYGDGFDCRFKKQAGYGILSVTVTMNGTDITQEVLTSRYPIQTGSASQPLLDGVNGNNNDDENVGNEGSEEIVDNEENNDNEQENGEQDNG